MEAYTPNTPALSILLITGMYQMYLVVMVKRLDVYLLGIDVPVEEYTARIIGIVHRHNDVEDKLVAAPEGLNLDQNKISEAVHFQEQYYESEIEIFN